jgi:hypothetical protein
MRELFSMSTAAAMKSGAGEHDANARPFQQKPLPALARFGIAAALYGILTPLVKGLELVGRADRVLGAMAAKAHKKMHEQNPFRGYTASEHDVFVAVYVKSGTNWTMQIVHQLLNHGNAEFDHIHCVVPWPDTPPTLGKYAIPVEDPSIWQASPEKKRVIKTHLEWDMIPYSGDAKYILVIRDPKDVFVSSYYFTRDVIFGPATPSVDTWYKLFLSPAGGMIGSWAEHSAGYWAQHNRKNVLVLSFKEMKRDLRAMVEKISKFLGVNATDDIINRVCEKSSFGYMKQIDQKFAPSSKIPTGRKATMMRKGQQGGSSELLTPAQQREMDAFFMAELKRVGSDFPYEEFCDVAK